jgi:NADPH:quinone reductase-like Zn-dependent oxidoreductase
MRQLTIPRHGPPEVLTIREAPDPAPGPGAVRIRVKAAGLNFSDLLARQGLYPDAPPLPAVMGYEVAGEIDELGAGVSGFGRGDRVLAMPHFGGQSDVVVVPSTTTFAFPPTWSFTEAAALPVVYLTAHHMLTRVAGARSGETVLVHSAAGGVGLAVAELARILGLRVIGLASAAKHGVLRGYGVEPLDRTDPHWPAAVRHLAPKGVDVVLDPIGGGSWREGYRLLAPLGRLVCYGASELSGGVARNLLRVVWRLARWPRFGPLALMNDNRAVLGVNLGHLWDARELLTPQVNALLGYAREGKVKPRVDRTFPLAEGAAAHRYLHERRNIGKVVLLP